MEVDRAGCRGEEVGRDPSHLRLAGDELIEQKAVRSQGERRPAQFGTDECRVFIAEAKDRGRLNADERLLLGDDARKLADIGLCVFFCPANKAFGK